VVGRSAIWQFFTYDAVTRKSTCSACEKSLAGQNPTNLRTHLKSAHKELSAQLEKTETETKMKSKESMTKKKNETSSPSVSIKRYVMDRKPNDAWAVTSKEYQK